MKKSGKIALVTAKAARQLDEDLEPLRFALEDLGASPKIVCWDDIGIDWSRYDLALLRSTWDYTSRLAEFLDWATQVASVTRLCNPFDVVCWNTDKHYLKDLVNYGVSVVPSFFIEPKDTVTELPDYDEFVIKPAVGAGSRDAQRYLSSHRNAALAHANRLLNDNRSVLVQPYLRRVYEYGETSLIFFSGKFSHAIRKGPLLKLDQDPTRALFATEHITARTPSPIELKTAEQALAALSSIFPNNKNPLLYARVDLILDQESTPRVLELELTEPSLFFAQADGSAQRFATAILSTTHR